MASFNRVILLGNLTRDIELKYTPGGTAVTEVGLAVNDRRKNQNGEWVDETTFVDVTFWGRTAEVASEYLGKGSSVLIEGRLKLDTWETDGQKRSKLRVVAERMQMTGGRGGSGPGAGGVGAGGAGASGGGQAPRGGFDESEFSHSTRHEHDPQPATAGTSKPSRGGAAEDDIPF